MRPRHSGDFKKEEKAVGWMSQERLIVKIYGVCFVCVSGSLVSILNAFHFNSHNSPGKWLLLFSPFYS